MHRRLLLILPILATTGAYAAPIGNAIAVRPQAELEGGTGTVTLSVGGGVEANNRVITGSAGETRLKFLDASTLDIGSNAAVTLDEFVYSEKKAAKAALTMTKGAFRWVTGQSPKEAYDLKTPLATIGIRGTDFRVDTDEKRTTIRLRSGAVHACNRVSNTCATINRPGQGVHLDADGKVEMFQERAQAIPPVLRFAGLPPAPPRSGPPPQRAERAPQRRVATYTPPPRYPRAPRQPVYAPDDYVEEYVPPRRRPPVYGGYPPRGPYGDGGWGRPPRGPYGDGGWGRPPRGPKGDGGWGRPPRGPYGDGGGRPQRQGRGGGFGGMFR
jgi:hypothetical protein